MPQQKGPLVTFAVLADAHEIAEQGKIDCFGIFDIMRVWAVPAVREFSIVFGLSDVATGNATLSYWLKDRKGILGR